MNNIFKNLAGASVKADPKTKKAAGIMLLNLLPFVMVTFSETFDSKSWDENIVLITLYFDKADQVKNLDHARFELMSDVHKHLQIFSPQNCIRDGQLSEESLKSLFEKIDVNKDEKIQVSEIKDLTLEFGMLGRVKCDIMSLPLHCLLMSTVMEMAI